MRLSVILSVFLVLVATCFTARGQKTINKITHAQLSSTAKAFWLSGGLQWDRGRWQPGVRLLVGRHHTFGSFGYGLGVSQRLYPGRKDQSWRLFFHTDAQVSVFGGLESNSVDKLQLAQIVGGYGVEWQWKERWCWYSLFGLGLSVERRQFTIPIDTVINFDGTGILVLGVQYTLPSQRNPNS